MIEFIQQQQIYFDFNAFCMENNENCININSVYIDINDDESYMTAKAVTLFAGMKDNIIS